MTLDTETLAPFVAPPLGFTALSDKNKDFCKPGTIIQAQFHIPCTKCLDQHFLSSGHSRNHPKDGWIDCWSNLLVLDAWERVDFGTYGPIKHWHVVLLKVLEDEKTIFLKIEKTNGWIHLNEYFLVLNPH